MFNLHTNTRIRIWTNFSLQLNWKFFCTPPIFVNGFGKTLGRSWGNIYWTFDMILCHETHSNLIDECLIHFFYAVSMPMNSAQYFSFSSFSLNMIEHWILVRSGFTRVSRSCTKYMHHITSSAISQTYKVAIWLFLSQMHQ